MLLDKSDLLNTFLDFTYGEMGKEKEKSEGKLKLTKEQEEKVIKKGVMAMTKIIERLEEENKKLKSDLAFERTMLDNVKVEYESLQNVNKKLKAQIEKMSGIGLVSAAPTVILDD